MPKSRKRKTTRKSGAPKLKEFTLFIRVPDGTGDKKSNAKRCFHRRKMLYSEAIKEAQRFEDALHSVTLFDYSSGQPVIAYRSKVLTRDGTGIVNVTHGKIAPNAESVQAMLHDTNLEDTDNGKQDKLLETNRIGESGIAGIDADSQGDTAL